MRSIKSEEVNCDRISTEVEITVSEEWLRKTMEHWTPARECQDESQRIEIHSRMISKFRAESAILVNSKREYLAKDGRIVTATATIE